jgi:hypothetical protein
VASYWWRRQPRPLAADEDLIDLGCIGCGTFWGGAFAHGPSSGNPLLEEGRAELSFDVVTGFGEARCRRIVKLFPRLLGLVYLAKVFLRIVLAQSNLQRPMNRRATKQFARDRWFWRASASPITLVPWHASKSGETAPARAGVYHRCRPHHSRMASKRARRWLGRPERDSS